MSWVSGAVSAVRLPAVRDSVLEARRELAQAVNGRLSTDTLERLAYSKDMWPLAAMWARQGRVPAPPDAVVWPSNEAELVELIRLARARQVPLVAFGGGSGVCGGTWAIEGGLIVDLKRFDSIDEVDVERRTVTVGAGVFGEVLERHLNARGYTCGHFPSSMAMSTVGGWLAARSAGQFSSQYGKIEDIVVSARFVTGEGEVLELPERPFSGPDVLPLLLGSEGLFGFFTSATLRVFPVASGRVFRSYEFASVERGLEAIRLMFREGLRPAVVRLYDPFDTALAGSKRDDGIVAPPSRRTTLERVLLPRVLRLLSKQALGRPSLLNQVQRPFRRSRLILVFEGDAHRIEAEFAAAAELCRAAGGTDLGESPARAWFAHRYDVAFRLSRLIDSNAFADTFEVAARWEDVLQVYEKVREAVEPHAFVMCHFSHAYTEGCSLYFTFVGSAGSEAEMEERYATLFRSALDAATRAGSNVSHHHGIGLLRARAYLDSLEAAQQTLNALKSVFDPSGLLNPGKWGGRAAPVARPAPSVSSALDETVHTPTSASELRDILRVSPTAKVDRAKLAFVSVAHQDSMTVEAGAGARLSDIEASLKRVGLSLGPLSASAWPLTLSEFLEGPHAGLRAIRGGRLEPLCLSVTAMTSDGRLLHTPRAPRQAAGPDLNALVLGAESRLVLLTSAMLRCQPRAEVDAHVTFHLDTPDAVVKLLRDALAQSVTLSSVEVVPHERHLAVLLRWQGSRRSVERDRDVLTRLAHDTHGRPAQPATQPLVEGPERESSWPLVKAALSEGHRLMLQRLSLSSVLVRGACEGVPLVSRTPLSPLAQRLKAVDPLAAFSSGATR